MIRQRPSKSPLLLRMSLFLRCTRSFEAANAAQPMRQAGTMYPYLWKGATTVALFLLLLLVASPRFMPKAVWTVSMALTLTYGISLFLNTEISLYRRLGIAYLAFVSLSYLAAGILGVIPNWDLIAASGWYQLISPYPLLALVEQWVRHRHWSFYGVPYRITPASDQEFRLFSIFVIVVSLVAIVGTAAMARNKRIAYTLWFGLVVISILASLGYVLADFADWGGIPRGGTHSAETIIALSWCASYVTAYLVARTGLSISAWPATGTKR